MNIRQRITLLIALTFVAISLIGGFAVFQSQGTAKEVRTVTQGVVPSALASAELVGQLKDVQLSLLMIVDTSDAQLAQQAKERLLEKQATLQKALDEQLRQADSDAQRGLVQQTKESLANYFAAIRDTVEFKLSGQTELAAANLAANVGGYLQEMESIIATLQIEKRRSKDQAILVLNENMVATTGTIAFVTVLAVLVLTSLGVLLYRQITHPISGMVAKMVEIASSQDFTQRVPVTRVDEIGRAMMAFNRMIGKIEESAGLIQQKTADIHAMLHAIPQGILTIEANNRIHPEYSVFLENILGTSDIAGGSLLEVVFAHTYCNADILAQIDATVGACVGEDAMNFEFNAHLLPTEIEKKMADGRIKILDLNWSAITDAQGITQRVLLCLRDVTELRALAAKANEQKRELAIIGEVLAVRHEKFHAFIDNARQFLEQNRTIIQEVAVVESGIDRASVVGQLFRNMHTIKGNARTYGLLHLTHVVHETEQAYDALRKDPSQSWDHGQLLAQLDATSSVVEEYARINEAKLGRKGPGRRGPVDKFLMVGKEHISATLGALDTVNQGSLPELREALRLVRYRLELMGTEKMEDILSGVLESLPSLARELGKAPPKHSLEDNGIVIRSQYADMLKNVFMHLYRNAVDHGLETPAQRFASDKAPAGHIRLRLALRDNELRLKLYDDGRGLAVHKIRNKALEKGLIQIGDVLSDEELAQLIFQPGFSTAQQVSEVSGRGVGMDAVKAFITAEGGSIELSFLGDADKNGFRPFKTIICLPAAIAVAPPAVRLFRPRADDAHPASLVEAMPAQIRVVSS